MPNLLAMSFEGELAPSFDLRCLQPGRKPPDGWGIGYYPGGDPSAAVLKEPGPPLGSIRSELVRAWEHLESSLFLLHIRTATWGNLSHANTQPFLRTHGGRDWLIAHGGSLEHRLEQDPRRPFTPVGSTDTELVFCELLSMLSDRGWRSLGDADLEVLRDWLHGFNTHGSLTIVITDGHDLLAYADREQRGTLFVGQLLPPYSDVRFGDDDLEVDLASRGVKSRKGVLLCSSELKAISATTATWRQLEPGQLLVVRQGAIRAELAAAAGAGSAPGSSPPPDPSAGAAQQQGSSQPGTTPAAPPQPSPTGLRIAGPNHIKRPTRAEVKRLQVRHRTAYRYQRPVERSLHLLRLEPAHNQLQHLLSHGLTLSVEGTHRDFEDVFGNRARRVVLESRYTELVIEAHSTVELLDVDPLSFRPLHARSTIPLVWMPWQGHMLQPYLLPPELPETQLTELFDYAMSFVIRNDYDLLDTLLDLNNSIFQEYTYSQGATTVFTTPFEVYTNRRGVCQDFTNLFICLARLLGVPARYVCGYIYTGPKNPNQRQSEASHAWVQVYLPEVGWKGFDPTNGVLTQTDHIRLAVGRNFTDATPTSGTLFVGGGPETLEVDVRVEPAP